MARNGLALSVRRRLSAITVTVVMTVVIIGVAVGWLYYSHRTEPLAPTEKPVADPVTVDPAVTQTKPTLSFSRWDIRIDGKAFGGLSLCLEKGGTVSFPLMYGSASLHGEDGTELEAVEDGVAWIFYYPANYPAVRDWDGGKETVEVPPGGFLYFLGSIATGRGEGRTWADAPAGFPPITIEDEGGG